MPTFSNDVHRKVLVAFEHIYRFTAGKQLHKEAWKDNINDYCTSCIKFWLMNILKQVLMEM